MYNIIRGMPMVMPQVWEGGEEGGRTGGRAAPVRVLTLSPLPSRPQRDGTIKLFLDGSSGQVGFEGYLVGTLYSSVGLAFWGLARGVPRLADEKARRAAGFALVAAAWVAYTRVVALHDWKTGCSWSWFLLGGGGGGARGVGGAWRQGRWRRRACGPRLLRRPGRVNAWAR